MQLKMLFALTVVNLVALFIMRNIDIMIFGYNNALCVFLTKTLVLLCVDILSASLIMNPELLMAV